MEFQFQGLIVHARVTDPDDFVTRDIAVLMGAPEHRAVVSIRDIHINFAKTTVIPIGTGVGVTCYALVDKVTSPTLGTGLAASRTLPRVPQLPRITTGGGAPTTVHPSVLRRAHDTKFHAYLELPPGGALDELNYFLDQVTFNGLAFGCIARTNRYRVNADGEITFTIRGRDLVVTQDAILYVTNASLYDGDGGSTVAHPHFPEYKNFFDPAATNIYEPMNAGPCRDGSDPDPLPFCAGIIDLDVDCSNTQFP